MPMQQAFIEEFGGALQDRYQAQVSGAGNAYVSCGKASASVGRTQRGNAPGDSAGTVIRSLARPRHMTLVLSAVMASFTLLVRWVICPSVRWMICLPGKAGPSASSVPDPPRGVRRCWRALPGPGCLGNRLI